MTFTQAFRRVTQLSSAPSTCGLLAGNWESVGSKILGADILQDQGHRKAGDSRAGRSLRSHQGHHPSELEDPPILCQPVSLPLLQYLQRRGPRLPGMPASLRPGEQVAGLT